jgi:hypothetical protein
LDSALLILFLEEKNQYFGSENCKYFLPNELKSNNIKTSPLEKTDL